MVGGYGRRRRRAGRGRRRCAGAAEQHCRGGGGAPVVVGSVAAGVLVGARSMLLSAHDSTVVLLVLLAAAPVALAFGVLLARMSNFDAGFRQVREGPQSAAPDGEGVGRLPRIRHSGHRGRRAQARSRISMTSSERRIVAGIARTNQRASRD